MRIGVDGRALVGEGASGLRQPRGVTRYVSSLLAAMIEGRPQHEWRLLLREDAGEIEFLGADVRRRRGSQRGASVAAAVLGRPRLDRVLGGDLDVVWLPSPAPVAVSRSTPYVLTVHDLSTEMRPADFGAYERVWAALARPRRLAARAAHVLVDAADVGEQIHAHWGLPRERVTLVQPGVWHPPPAAPAALAALRARHRLPARFLLYVGALERRKGLDVLLEAFTNARSRGMQAGLVLAGDGELAGRLDAPGVVLTGRLPDVDLAALYGAARATVLPSLLEGFGFTPLESLAAGTPAITSDLPSIRETLGEAGLFVAAGDVAAMAEALLAVDRDDALCARLVSQGAAAVGNLSWERAAEQAMAVLERAAAQGPR